MPDRDFLRWYLPSTFALETEIIFNTVDPIYTMRERVNNGDSKNIFINIDDQKIRFSMNDKEHALFLSLGWTFSELQSFEIQIAIYLTTVYKFEDELNFDEKMQYFLKDTLGKMIRTLSHSIDDNSILDLLKSARDKRNFFVHRFLHQRWPSMKKGELIDMLIELKELREFFIQVGDTVLVYLRDVKDAPIIGIKDDPVTGQPVEI